jgi:hypothetical protein
MVMKRHIRKICILFTALIVLVTAYGLFRLRQYRTHSHRVDDAFTKIVDALSADPHYFVSEHLVVTKGPEPDFSDLSYLLNPVNQILQVCVRKAFRKGPFHWALQTDQMFQQFPEVFRPSRDLYLTSKEYNWIMIKAVEPTEEEMQKIKELVSSLGISRDIRIDVSSWFPDRELLRQERQELLSSQFRFNRVQ